MDTTDKRIQTKIQTEQQQQQQQNQQQPTQQQQQQQQDIKYIDELVIKLLTYRNKNNGRLYEALNQDYLLNLLEKSKIIEIEKNFPSKGLDIIDFVRLFLNSIPHREDEILYLTISLVELFKRISESLNLSTTIKMKHITSIICERMQEKDSAQYKIQTVLVPESQKFMLNIQKIRSIDIDPPPIYGRYDEDLQRLVKQKIKTDSMHHLNHRIKTGVYAKDMKRIISLDSLSDRINMYSIDCEFKQYIRPKTNSPQEKIASDIIIFSFAWSERQERLGATLKDFSLSFWDRSDNFKYEKQIQIQSFMSDYQTNIWYLEFPNAWVTTDAKNQLYEWDLEKEVVKRTLSSPKIKHTIFEVVEIPELKLIAIGSSDRLVTIWDFHKANMVQLIEFHKAGIHSLVYFKSYQVLVCGGFQNNISIFQIDPKYLDVNTKGSLIGHQSMITAIDCVEKTPMIISSDDSGTIKIWDIRTLKCIQTVDCGQRTVISKIINIYPKGKLCFLGTRINVIDFDESDLIIKKANQKDDAFPIKIENTPNELIVVTRKDIRFIDISSGKMKQLFVGLLSDGEDEITAFKQIEQGSKFILGNHRGEISLHNIQNGELINKLHSHSNEVTSIRIDYLNKLLISGGWDSNIKIQHLTDTGSEIKREIINCFYNKEVTIIEVSVYHNLLFVASNSEKIYVFDYEFAKLLYCIELEQRVEIQAMNVVNGFNLIFISGNNGMIYIMSFLKKESVFSVKLIGIINIPQLIKYHLEQKEEYIPGHSNNYNLNMNVSQNDNNNNQQNIHPITISQIGMNLANSKHQNTPQVARNNKNVFDYNHNNTLLNQSSYSMANSTAKIIAANRLFIPQVSQFQHNQQNQYGQQQQQQQEKNMLSTSRSNQQDEQLSEGVPEDQNNIESKNENNKKMVFVNKILIDSMVNETSNFTQDIFSGEKQQLNDKRKLSSNYSQNKQLVNNKLTKLSLYCSLNKGDILAINLLPFYELFDNIQFVEHCNTRINYNAYRANTENFLKSIEQIKNEKIQFSGNIKLNNEGRKCTDKQLHASIYKNIIFYKQGAHKDIFTSLKMINLKENYLLTSSMDSFIKVWNKDTGELKASLNINHPLPLVWNIDKDILQEGKKKIIFALKIIDVIYKKYGKDLTFQEQRKVKVTNFLANVLSSKLDSEEFYQYKSQQPKDEIIEQLKQIPLTEWISRLINPKDYKGEVLLMKDEYSPRDLKYDKSKQIFQSELTGPSLKRMEANKRVAMATKVWKQENETKEAELENQLKNENTILKNYKAEEREELIYFLEQNYREKLLNNEFFKIQEEFTKGTTDLNRKLDLQLIQKRHFHVQSQQQSQMSNTEYQRRMNTKQQTTVIPHSQLQSQLSFHINNNNNSTNNNNNNNNSNNNTNNLSQTIPQKEKSDSIDINQDPSAHLLTMFSKRRQDEPITIPKNYQIDKKYNKKDKNQKKSIKLDIEQPNLTTDFYMYAKERQLINQNGNSLNTSIISTQQIMNKHYSQHNKYSKSINKLNNSQLNLNSILNNSTMNQSSLINPAQSTMIGGGVDTTNNIHEESGFNQIINNNNNVNSSNINNKNNSTTIGPNSTILNTIQSEKSLYNILNAKKINKVSKLSNVLKSMDQKIKKSQQNFNDDLIIQEFLSKRKNLDISQINQNELSAITQNKQQQQQQQQQMQQSQNNIKQASMNSSFLPNIKGNDNILDNQIIMEDSIDLNKTKPRNSLHPQKIQQNLSKSKQSSNVLTQNGLQVLKKVLYDNGQNYKSQINGIQSKSKVNKSTPNLFWYQINDQNLEYQQKNLNKTPTIKLSQDSDDILQKISQNMSKQAIQNQKLQILKDNLSNNIQNAFSLYQHIENSLADATPHVNNHNKPQQH